MVGVNHRLQLLPGQRTVDCLTDNVPGAAGLFIDDLVPITAEGQGLTVKIAIKDPGRPYIFCLGNDPGAQSAAGATAVEDGQITAALAVVDDPHFSLEVQIAQALLWPNQTSTQ